MTTLSSTLWLVVAAALVLGAAGWLWRRRRDVQHTPDDVSVLATMAQDSVLVPGTAHDALETVRVLGALERMVMSLLCNAFPRARVLAHVPLTRFIRLPPRELRPRWMQGAGAFDADLVLCDARYQVLAVIDIRNRGESVAHDQRNEHMARVVRAAGLPVLVWHEDSVPANLKQVREAITALVNDPVLETDDRAARSDTGWAVHPATLQPAGAAGAVTGGSTEGETHAPPGLGKALPAQTTPDAREKANTPQALSMLERAVLLIQQKQG